MVQGINDLDTIDPSRKKTSVVDRLILDCENEIGQLFYLITDRPYGKSEILQDYLFSQLKEEFWMDNDER